MIGTEEKNSADADLARRRENGERRRESVLGESRHAAEDALARLVADAEAEFVWGTAWAGPRLDDRTRAAIALAISLARASTPATRRHTVAALRAGWSRAEVAEIVLHVACYAGFLAVEEVLPAVSEALGQVDRNPASWPETARAPVGGDAPADPPAQTEATVPKGAAGPLAARGLAVRREIFGAADIDAWMEKTAPDKFMMAFFDATHAYCFGTLWSRPGLERRMRSVLSLAINASQSQAGAVARHVRSCVMAGLTKLEIAEILLLVYAYTGVYASLGSFMTANDVFATMEAEGHRVAEG